MPFGCFGKRKKKDKAGADGAALGDGSAKTDAAAGGVGGGGVGSGDIEVSETVTAARAQSLHASASNIQKSATLARYDFLRKSDCVNSADRWAALKEQYLAPKMSQSQHHGDSQQLAPPTALSAANGPARGPGRAAHSLPRQFSPPSTVVSVVKFSHWFYERQVKEEEARREAHEREERSRVEDEQVESAATKIQAGFRGYQTRKHLAEARSHPSEQHPQLGEPQHPDESGHRAGESPLPAPAVDGDEDRELNVAATKIQAGFKGMQARKEVRELRKHQNPEAGPLLELDGDHHSNEDHSADEMNAAAVKIQAGFKGYKTRKDMGRLHDQHPEQHQQQPQDGHGDGVGS